MPGLHGHGLGQRPDGRGRNGQGLSPQGTIPLEGAFRRGKGMAGHGAQAQRGGQQGSVRLHSSCGLRARNIGFSQAGGTVCGLRLR